MAIDPKVRGKERETIKSLGIEILHIPKTRVTKK